MFLASDCPTHVLAVLVTANTVQWIVLSVKEKSLVWINVEGANTKVHFYVIHNLVVNNQDKLKVIQVWIV